MARSWRMPSKSSTMRRAQPSTRSPSGCQPVVALAAHHDWHAEFVLELADAARERRLRDKTRLGGAGEVLFPREGDQVTQLPDIHAVPPVAEGSWTMGSRKTASVQPLLLGAPRTRPATERGSGRVARTASQVRNARIIATLVIGYARILMGIFTVVARGAHLPCEIGVARRLPDGLSCAICVLSLLTSCYGTSGCLASSKRRALSLLF